MPTKTQVLDQDTEMILRDRIFRYIFRNPNGVNMSELETKFGESRMRIGYIINKLYEDRKICKTSNIFYPLIGL